MVATSLKMLSVVLAIGVALHSTRCYSAAQQDDGEIQGVLSGRLVDEDGNPVTDAEIALQGPSYFRTQTDENGNWSFLEKIEAGEYRLSIKSQDWVGITDYREMPKLAIAPDHPSQKNFTLKRACRIALTVVDENGEPIRAAVYYQPIAGERFRNADRVVTDAEGMVDIGGLDATEKRYIIGVSSQSHAFEHAIVDVSAPGEVVKQSIVLQVGKPVKGMALCSDGEPPSGWKLYAMPTWWNFGSYPVGATVAEDGSFELPHIGDGKYNILIFIPTGGGMSMSRSVISDVELNSVKQPLQLSVDYPSPKSMNYLTGTIRWVGKPLKEALSISGYSAELKHHTDYRLESGAADFKIGPIPKGTYRIRVDHPQIETMNLRKIKNLNDLDHVKIPNEEPLQLVLRVRRPAGVQGRVRDAETQEPIKNFRYRITKLRTLSGPNYVQEDEWRFAKGDSGGFQSEVVGPGIYIVTVAAEGYAIQTSEAVNTDEQPDEVLEFDLSPGVSLVGEVVDGNGQPVNGATVRALSLTAGAMPRTLDRFVTMEGAVETEDGKFELRNLQEGSETIRIDHPEFAFKVVSSIEVGKKSSEPLRVQLSNGATIRGTVYDGHGKPQANETLLFQDDYAYGGSDREAGAFGKAVTDSDGQYEIAHLPETIVYVSRAEEWEGRGVVRHAVQTRDGASHQLNLGGPNEMVGKFIVNDEPLKNVRLQLGGDDPVFGAMKMFVSTDEAGGFCFFGAPPGHWTLYRALGERGSEWAKVREVEIPASGEFEFGEIRRKSGKITVQCNVRDASLLETLQMELRQYSPRHFFGRSAANRQPRDQPTDPFVFFDVTQGDFELACRTASGLSIIQRLTVTESDLNSVVPFDVPSGSESLTLNIRNESGDPHDASFMLISRDERLLSYLYPNQSGESPAGTYTAEYLPAGRYKLHLGNARNAPAVATIEVNVGQVNEMDLSIPSQQHLAKGIATLVITDEQGVFLPCKVELEGKFAEDVEQYQGRFRLDLSGEPGTYPMSISHPGFEPVRQSVVLAEVDSLDPSAPVDPLHVQLVRRK